MFKKIQNLTKRLVMLRLNSGKTLFLDPGAISKEIPGVELENNTIVKKLQYRRVIDVHPHPAVKRHPAKRPKKESPAPEPAADIKEQDKIKKDNKQKKSKTKGGK